MTNNNEGIGHITQNAYNTMKEKDINRLTIETTSLDEPTTETGFIDLERLSYHDKDTLSGEELERIEEGKPYTAISLTYNTNGEEVVEIAERNPTEEGQLRFLPKIAEDTGFGDYLTTHHHIDPKKWEESIPASPTDIEHAVHKALQDYKNQTTQRMKQAGVYNSLRQQNQKTHPVEELEERLGTSLESKLYK